MKAARLQDYGGVENFRYEDVPDPVAGPGQVVVRVKAAGINPVDYKLRSGAFKDYIPLALPMSLGNDIAGIVESVAADAATDLKPGDRVLAMTPVPVGGGYAEKIALPAADVVRLPDSLSFEAGAALPMVALTAHLAFEALAPQPGQTVLVSGALGSIGRLVVQWAVKAGAAVYAGVRAAQAQEAEAELKGLTGVVALDAPDALKGLTFDAVVDTVSGPVGDALLKDHVRRGGTFVALNQPSQPPPEHSGIILRIVGVKVDAAALRTLVERYGRGEFELPVARTFPLAEAGAAQAAAEESGSHGKIVLTA